MVKAKSASLERIESAWADSLAKLPTILSRLELLSSLRDPHTGRYVHHGMSLSAGDQTHLILLKSHLDTFAEWQTMSLQQQMGDLKQFVRSVSKSADENPGRITQKEKRKLMLETWTQLEPYRNFVPQSVSRLERDLFMTNLASIVSVLKEQISQE
jgi:hypothetical protein